MSRWADDPERAADELIVRSLTTIELDGRILLANHQAGTLPALVAGRGLAVASWNRRLGPGGHAEPWPPAGPFDVTLLRLPRAKAEQEMAAHATLSVLTPGGRLIVYGGNDEGIRPFAGLLANLCGEVETLATRGHGRVAAVRRPSNLSHLRGALGDWRSTVPLEIGGVVRDWASFPGIFAADRIDEGTQLLIGALPPLAASVRVLDYGCGSGVIAASVRAPAPAVALDLLDNDAVALEAARENVAGARIMLGNSLAAAGAVRYDAILSNPPLHQGFAEDHGLLEQLIADAPRHLAPAGVLQIVVQRRIPLDRMFAEHFAGASVVAESSRYRVWRVQGIPSPRPSAGRGLG
jgi:16S rRNA (guanine1207-N2)-methyltransferase